MFTSAYKRLLQKDYKHSPFIGNFQYPRHALSPICTYSSPYIGSVDHSKVCDYFEVRKKEQSLQDRRIKKILVELSRCKEDWVKVSIETAESADSNVSLPLCKPVLGSSFFPAPRLASLPASARSGRCSPYEGPFSPKTKKASLGAVGQA